MDEIITSENEQFYLSNIHKEEARTKNLQLSESLEFCILKTTSPAFFGCFMLSIINAIVYLNILSFSTCIYLNLKNRYNSRRIWKY